MKKRIKISVSIVLLSINLLYADGNNTAIILKPPKSNQVVMEQKKRIEINFKTIDTLLAKIQGRIEEVEELRETIEIFIKDGKMQEACASINSLNEDLFSLKQEIQKVNDESRRLKLEEKITVYESVVNEEKAYLNNYKKCPKVGK